MMKTADSLKTIESQAIEALRRLLERVPTVRLLAIETGRVAHEYDADVVANVEASGKRYTLACQVKFSGQPRYVRSGLLGLQHHIAKHSLDAIPVFIAPYLSLDAQKTCQEFAASYLDFEGNARLQFDSVYVELQVANKPSVERRELQSLFKPKSAQVLRVMLRDPTKMWRVSELAEASDVSLGHISNVRTALLNREWAEVSSDGVFLSDPDALLDEWRNAYEPPDGTTMNFYTSLHGAALEQSARQVFDGTDGSGRVAYASFSAANWLAPYGRIGTHYFYADAAGLEHLRTGLKLSSAAKGENISVTLLKDADLFRDMVNPAAGVICTSPVQTYLDLTASGERAREAAEHLRQKGLTWQQSK